VNNISPPVFGVFVKMTLQKNMQGISGTSYPRILAIKKKRDLDNNKARCQSPGTGLRDELARAFLPGNLKTSVVFRYQSSYHTIRLVYFRICMIYPVSLVPTPGTKFLLN